MQKLIVAVAAVLITGVAGFSVAGGDAQEARIVRPSAEKVEVVQLEDEDPVTVYFEDYDTFVQRAPQAPQFAMLNMRQGQPGTWQLVSHGNLALLLNTATGDTFTLEKGEEGLHWKPIPRPMQEMPMMHRMREMPDMKGIEEKLEVLRKELRNTKGDARERIEKAIEELEQVRARSEKPDRARDPQPRKEGREDGADRERAKDNTEDQLREIEETIAALKERYDESDSVKEREKIERTIKELKEKAEGLRKERKSR